ncbi:MAG TPA: DUF2500 domain-containing protein [Clostridia bacterium]|nr:DUF2500 domain-containing protein [Clostridia bacterium]
MFGGGILFSVIPVIVTLGFVVVFGIIIVIAVRGIAQWNRNNNSPVLCVFATIVAKRANTSHHHHQHADNMAMSHSSSSTSYYVTFEVDSGDRMELHMNGEQYGLLIEGDKGRLTFQGTRYLGFERQK